MMHVITVRFRVETRARDGWSTHRRAHNVVTDACVARCACGRDAVSIKTKPDRSRDPARIRGGQVGRTVPPGA